MLPRAHAKLTFDSDSVEDDNNKQELLDEYLLAVKRVVEKLKSLDEKKLEEPGSCPFRSLAGTIKFRFSISWNNKIDKNMELMIRER